MIFLDPTSDIAFKKLFGSSEHKNVLMSFLNSVLERHEGERIIEVIINDPSNHPETIESKASIVDVRCSDQQGNNYIVEMQVVKQQDYAARCQYYSALALSRQLKQGEKFEQLAPVIFIGVMDFELLKSSNYISHHLILNKETREHSLRHLEFHFVELKKFSKSLDELHDDLEKWTYLLKNAKAIEKVPTELKKPVVLQEAFDILAQSNWSIRELEAYDRYIDAMRSRENQLETAYEDGKMEGEINKARIIAKNMLAADMDITQIVKITGLNTKELEDLTKELAQKK